ncbi:fungal-specific transcription factor domain-containing protein [Aspergillus germanicus]
MQNSAIDVQAEKPCHNCRRRRLKCDRSLPTCVKCSRTGQACLGYGKLFLWNQGVASRGRMMGKTFPILQPQCGTQYTLAGPRGLAYTAPSSHFHLHAPLLDPVFGDIDYTSRQYLFHFASSLSSDMVISSADSANPFCRLIPLAREHPILLHAIVANAALNISCLHQRSNGTLDLDTFLPSQPQPQWHMDISDPSARAKVDALSAKHRALVLLRHDLEKIHSTTSAKLTLKLNLNCNDVGDIDMDLIITVVHLFITFDLIDVDECEWKPHVQGAIRLISCLQSFEGGSRRYSPLADIRDSIMSDCLTYYILGSTLLRTPTLQNPFIPPPAENSSRTSNSPSIIESLTRAETNSYLSLPTPLLQILFHACELANHVSISLSSGSLVNAPGEEEYQSMLATARSLLGQVSSFDVVSWAEGLECSSSPERRQSRIHTALAHQAAVRIYIIRSVDGLPHPVSSPPTTNPNLGLLHSSTSLDEDPSTLVHTIVSNLNHVDISDPLFKATCWPTFIAGAETDDPVYREWAVERLREFWALIPWGYIRTAVEVMRMSWAVRDGDGNADELGAGNVAKVGRRGRGWIQGLKALERDWLIA